MRVRFNDVRLYAAALVLFLVYAAWQITPRGVRGVPVVVPGDCPMTIADSVPADGFIDVLHYLDGDSQPAGISVVHVQFTQSVQLQSSDITVLSTGDAPSVLAVSGMYDEWDIVLDGPPEPGTTTALAFCGGTASIIFHSRPGDFDYDGDVDASDVSALAAAVGAGSTALGLHDFDRNGVIDGDDVDLLDAVLEAEGFDPAIYGSNPTQVLCCCESGYCSMRIGPSCGSGCTETDCPCAPTSCADNGNSS